MIVLACSIILLHAFVPHHHHDSGELHGLVYENELTCHCNHDNDKEHEDGNCRLQDLLSQLVIGVRDDRVFIESDGIAMYYVAVMAEQYTAEPYRRLVGKGDDGPRLKIPSHEQCGEPPLRAPPVC